MIAIYTRVSTDEQRRKGLSLAEQKKRGIEYANEIGEDFIIYEDGGHSGTIPHSIRKGSSKLFEDIKAGKIKILYVTAWDRLSRGEQSESEEIIRKLVAKKVVLVIRSVEYDLEDPVIKFLLNMHQLLANLETAKSSVRIKYILKQNAVEGKAAGGPIVNYGYKKDENKYLIVDENEAKVVHIIYQLALQGKGTKSIATILNENEIPTKRNNITVGKAMTVKGEKKTSFKWRDAVIYRILTNPIYIGKRLLNTYGEDEEGKRIVTKSELIDIPIETLVDPVTFETIQGMLKERDRFKDTTTKYHFLLKGLIDCPVCHGKFVGKYRPSKKDHSYSCNSKRHSEFCGNRGIDIDYLEKLVCDSVSDLGNIISKAVDNNEVLDDNKRIKADLKKKETDLSKLRVDATTLVDFLLDSKNSKAVKTKLGVIERQIEQLEHAITVLKKQLVINNDIDSIVEVANAGAKQFKKLKKFEDKREFIRNVIHFITVLYDSNSLTYDITIAFRINQLENHLITKLVTVNRTSRDKNHQTITKLLNEQYDIRTFFIADEAGNVSDATQTEIHYTDYSKLSPTFTPKK